jgi:hypothetical protein
MTCVLGFAQAAVAGPPDWLIDPSSYKSVVREDKATRDLVLTNGLVRRTIRLAPNAATVGLENLITGEQMLRAVAPEGRIALNGTDYAIGGLSGQRIKNYLKAEWIADLEADPQAYRFAGWEEGPIQARFPWKKRTEWLARDLPWPPPGRHVWLTFTPPLAAAALSGPIRFEDDFGGPLEAGWKVTASARHPRSSFADEGKVGHIAALPDTCVYAERRWPADAVVAEVTVSAGDDARSNSWGPGLALVLGERIASIVARPASGEFEVGDPGSGSHVVGKFDRGKPVVLRARLETKRIAFEASQDGGKTFALIARTALPKAPTAIRVGKVGKGGFGKDYETAAGEPIRCSVDRVVLRGAEPSGQGVPRPDLPVVEVHYEIYDGLPLFSKWLVVKNGTDKAIRVTDFVAEELRLVEPESAVDDAPDQERPNLFVETDYAFGAINGAHAARHTVSLLSDPDYPTQVHYERKTRCLLKVKPPIGPDWDVAPGQSFETFRAFELLFDTTDRERRGLAQRRMYRTIAPWSAENPLMFHVRSADPAAVRLAIDQASEVGFEMIIMTFWSGFEFESRDPKYQAKYKQLVDEAKAKGLALGGYSLLASRGAGTAADNTQGQPARFGVMPCLGSKWGRDYLDQLKHFTEVAGLGVLEHDGSYPGDKCDCKTHPGHHGLADSQWAQWRAITDLYKWCRSEGVFLNVPDWYFLTGSNKTGMGYRESNWSLPRAEQELIERQNIYDGTWTKTGSMGWMMVPLTEYQGGGPAATIEPLDKHRDHYEARLANLLGAGVQACYRGPRLYDTDATKALVKKWVAFYKAHREVLDGDLIHLRRADGRDWDGWLHVDPQGKEKGLAFFYNPLSEDIEREIRVPLYFTGLTGAAQVSVDGAAATAIALDRTESATLKVRIPARSRTWFLFTAASSRP